MHKSTHLASLIAVSLLAACSDGGSDYTPTFEETACWGGVTDPAVQCGFVTVPENRDRPDGAQVRLAVARLASTGDATNVPLIYLHGGPGGDVLRNLSAWTGSSFRAQGDLILLDQRGGGFSEPLLNCPEREEQTWLNFASTGDLPAEVAAMERATLECQARLEASGIDLSSYDTVQNALDVADVRIALGIDEWNVYSISYGTSLALQTMRSRPEGIRAVVLDSAYPMHRGLSVEREAGTADRVVGALAEGCARDPACLDLVDGDMVGYFYDTIAEFDADPYEIDTVDERNGGTRTIHIDGSDVFAGVFNALYDTELIAIAPLIFQQIRSRNPVFLQTAADQGVNRINDLNEMAFLAIECRDRGHQWTKAGTDALLAARPEVTSLYNVFAQPVCEAMDLGTIDPGLNTPVESDIPTLVLAGEFDPITPPDYGISAAERLGRSTYLEFPGVGHGVAAADPCPFSIMTAFLDAPDAPADAACIADMNDPFP